jgi:hypothetical protein
LIKVAKVNKVLAFEPKETSHCQEAKGFALAGCKSNPDFPDSGISQQNFILPALKLHEQKRGYSFAPEIFENQTIKYIT